MSVLTNLPKVMPFFGLVPPALRDRSVIAGGAAVDFDKAGDVDIWILTPKNKFVDRAYIDELVYALDEHLSVLSQNAAEGKHDEFDAISSQTTFEAYIPGEPSTHVVEPNTPLGQMPNFLKGVKLIQGAVSDGEKSKSFQIMHTQFTTLADLLNNFDLSVHQAGFSPSGAFTTVGTTTKPGEKINVLRTNDAAATVERLQKLYARYGIAPQEQSQ